MSWFHNVQFAENGAYLHAGPEFSVASTKAVTNTSHSLSFGSISDKSAVKILHLTKWENPKSVQILEDDGSINAAVSIISNANSAIFIGRESLTSSPRASQMMEVAYLPCILSGGMKHGPIALSRGNWSSQ